jgi:hypothetical protein
VLQCLLNFNTSNQTGPKWDGSCGVKAQEIKGVSGGKVGKRCRPPRDQRDGSPENEMHATARSQGFRAPAVWARDKLIRAGRTLHATLNMC